MPRLHGRTGRPRWPLRLWAAAVMPLGVQRAGGGVQQRPRPALNFLKEDTLLPAAQWCDVLVQNGMNQRSS